MSGATVHFVRLRPGESIGNPSWVLRRVTTDAGVSDELLGPDGQWRPAPMLARAERGELPGTLRRIGDALAEGLMSGARKRYAAVERALAGQQVGDFPLRLASAGAGDAGEPLDDEKRAEVVAFLTGAPPVTAGFRTDGMWVWPEALAATVLASGMSPEGVFLHHIEERAYLFPAAVAPDVLERARQLLEAAAAGDGTAPVRETAVPGRPAPPTQQERLRELAAWHAEWQRRHAAGTPYRPELHPGDPDYDLHHVDVEASAAAEQEFTARAREIMGLDRDTGRPVDL